MSEDILLDDIEDYWEMVERKQDRATAFIDNPSRESFAELVDKQHFWATRARGSTEKYIDKFVFAEEQTPERIAQTLQKAVDSGEVEELTNLNGFGWATGTEILRALAPDQFAILNTRSKLGLEALGYSAPNKNTASQAEYDAFVENVRDASRTYELETLVEEVTGNPIPEWATELEVADFAFSLHHDEKCDLTTLTEEQPPPVTLDELGRENAAYYWVNQSNQPEIKDGYLRAKVDNHWHHDLARVSSGDIIFHNFDDELLGISVATDSLNTYTFRGEQYHRLDVDFHWFDDPIAVDAELKTQLGDNAFRLEEYYPINQNNNLKQAYLSDLSEDAAAFLLKQAEFRDGGQGIGEHKDRPNPEKPTDAEELERQLKQKKQVVFYGPPGTGKTFRAERFAKWWAADQDVDIPLEDRIETVTFHPSFTYEDFIEGLTVESTDEGALTYDVEDGVLKRIRDAAKTAYDDGVTDSDGEPPRYILVIDEINRGNLAQIFGETITLLEADKRETTAVTLAHSGDTSFTLPPNLYIIGTMNTADRSIALVDAALRRRFRFIDIPPEVEVLYEEYDIGGSEDVDAILAEEPTPLAVLQALSIRAWERLNENILDSPDLGKGKQIGHSYLMGLTDPTTVREAWRYDVLPLLEEYHFGQFDRIRQDLFDGTSDPILDPDTERITSFTIQELVDALSDFVGVDIQTDFEDIETVTVDSSDESNSQDSSQGFPSYPDTFESAQRDIFDRAADLLGAEELAEVSHEDVNRRSLRFESTKEYVPDTVQFVFKPEPERNGQTIVHVNSEDEEDRVSDILSAHADRYESEGFEVTDSSTYRIVQRTWPFEDTENRDGRELVAEFRDSPEYETAIEAFVDLIRITDAVFKESEFAEGTPDGTD